MSTAKSLILSPKRRALFNAMLREQRENDGLLLSAVDGKICKEQQAYAPLSFAQERLWFLDQFETDHPVYNIPVLLRLPGAVSTQAIERAIGEIIRRHGVFRTTFHMVDNRPVQMVSFPQIFELPIVDLQQFSAVERESALKRIISEERDHRFDLARGPVFRAKLVRLEKLNHAIVFNMHHIVSDGWSIGVLMREFHELYEALSTNRPSRLPELPLQYIDFARQQREELSEARVNSLLSFWRQKLEGAPRVIELPTDRPRPKHQTFAGETQLFSIPKPIVELLLKLSRSSGVTLFMTLLAAFNVLLSRYTGKVDLIVGTPVANRNRVDVEPLIGFFVNTLILRTDLSCNPSFRELLQRVRESTLESFANQELPFEKLVQELQPDRNLSHSPLFQVMFALQNTMRASDIAANASYDATNSPTVVESTPKFDLSLFFGETQNGLIGEIEYNTDLFDRLTMTRMIGHIQCVLEAVVENPDVCLSEVPLLSKKEKQQILTAGAGKTFDFPNELCVHELFITQAQRTPDAAAIDCHGKQMSYRELDSLTNQVARHLYQLGVEPDMGVGICLDRSFDMIAAVLGILKSGGAYVPLDPSYPHKRLAFMAEDAGISILITHRHLLHLLPSNIKTVIIIEDEWETISKLQKEAIEVRVMPDNLAYIIYTSGSTGQPKGVGMSHRPLFNLIQWQTGRIRIMPSSRILQFAPLSFDVSFQEMFSTWNSGGTLVLIDEHNRRDFESLCNYISQTGITNLYLPPVALAHLADAAIAIGNYPGSLREIVCAGDKLAITPNISQLAKRTGARLVNQYGPTETHVVSEFVLETISNESFLPPIGRAIDNTRLYVLDEQFQSVPFGVPGQLFIGGVAPARGYLSRPALTAERFLPDPFGDPGTRMYKTGDYVRLLPDGNLVFLGRLDDQVKIRGFRIETGEIEATLCEQEDVEEAAVITRREDSQLSLVAYVVSKSKSQIQGNILRQFLNDRLPAYMVPSAFIQVDALPISPSGKVDRQALPISDFCERQGENFSLPRTSLEKVIAQVWAEVLRLDKVGVEDNFFELGGHSLLATQVISRLRPLLAADLPLRIMFEPPSTVAELARAVVIHDLEQMSIEEAEGLIDKVEHLDKDALSRELALS